MKRRMSWKSAALLLLLLVFMTGCGADGSGAGSSDTSADASGQAEVVDLFQTEDGNAEEHESAYGSDGEASGDQDEGQKEETLSSAEAAEASEKDSDYGTDDPVASEALAQDAEETAQAGEEGVGTDPSNPSTWENPADYTSVQGYCIVIPQEWDEGSVSIVETEGGTCFICPQAEEENYTGLLFTIAWLTDAEYESLLDEDVQRSPAVLYEEEGHVFAAVFPSGAMVDADNSYAAGCYQEAAAYIDGVLASFWVEE